MINNEPQPWSGRDDCGDEGSSARRWHQCVKPFEKTAAPGVTIIGFACDEGVRRNQGRVGAAEGPRCLRKALANLAWHQDHPVYDGGDLRCVGDELESAQDRLAEMVAAVLLAGQRPLVLGGGHETAWGTAHGLFRARPEQSVGIINIDSHFDLRKAERGNSGTVFAQVADSLRDQKRPFHCLCLGIARHANTAAFFHRADSLGVKYLEDGELLPWRLGDAIGLTKTFVEAVDCVYLSLDLDVLIASEMPAVSAPAIRGIALESVEFLVDAVIGTGRLAAVDVVEFNPKYDCDGRAARVAAGLIWRIARAWV